MTTIHQVSGARPITSNEHDAASAGGADHARSALLPEPADMQGMSGADTFEALARLLEGANQSDRRAAREQEANESVIQAHEDDAKVQAMRDKASAEGTQGEIEGATQIGEGLCEGAAGYWGTSSAPDASAMPTKAARYFTGAERGFQASGSVLGKAEKATADRFDADAATHGASASTAERASKLAHEKVEDVRESMEKVAKFLDEVEAGMQASRNAAVIRG